MTHHEIDYSIVNLQTQLIYNSMFVKIHLQGTAVLNNDKDFDFKPGQKLNEFIDVYLQNENEDLFIMASHVEKFKLSECYKSSEMTCITL